MADYDFGLKSPPHRFLHLRQPQINYNLPINTTIKTRWNCTVKHFATNQNATVGKLFSASVIGELTKAGKSPSFARQLQTLCNLEQTPSGYSVGDIFDEAYEILKRPNNRNEYIYKSAITEKVLLGIHSLKTASLLTEFRIGKCIADVVLLNGTGTVYEIKSERDSLSRLEEQIHAYRDVFASVCVIAGENHIKSVLDVIPKDVGVIKLSKRHQLTTIRQSLNVPERTKSGAIFDAIRMQEAKTILTRCGYEVPDLPNTKMYATLKHLFKQIPAEVAHTEMVRTLKATRDQSKLSSFIHSLPKSLQTIGLTTPMKRTEQRRLLDALNTPLTKAMEWNS